MWKIIVAVCVPVLDAVSTGYIRDLRAYATEANTTGIKTLQKRERQGEHTQAGYDRVKFQESADVATSGSAYGRQYNFLQHDFSGPGYTGYEGLEHQPQPQAEHFFHESYHQPHHESYHQPHHESYLQPHHVDLPHGHHGHYDHHTLAVKSFLIPLAGIALLSAAAALVSNPVLLQLGVVSGKRRKRRDLPYHYHQQPTYEMKMEPYKRMNNANMNVQQNSNSLGNSDPEIADSNKKNELFDELFSRRIKNGIQHLLPEKVDPKMNPYSEDMSMKPIIRIKRNKSRKQKETNEYNRSYKRLNRNKRKGVSFQADEFQDKTEAVNDIERKENKNRKKRQAPDYEEEEEEEEHPDYDLALDNNYQVFRRNSRRGKRESPQMSIAERIINRAMRELNRGQSDSEKKGMKPKRPSPEQVAKWRTLLDAMSRTKENVKILRD